jgi:hypothetical protein
MRVSVAGGALCALLVLTGIASGAASFSDPTGDGNAAPDITSVAVTEPVAGTLTVSVSVANYQTLPAQSWFNIWFDLDRNPQTGDDQGDEAVVRFFSEGDMNHEVWNGSAWTDAATTGMAGSFSAGVATVNIPRTGIFAVSSLGVLAVSARGQTLAGDEYISSDFAPSSGRSAWTSPTPLSVPDPSNDNDSAPDIGRVQVVDRKDGWIRFSIATPNRTRLLADSAILMAIDADNKPRTGSGGADVRVTDVGGNLTLEKWNPARRAWRPDTAPTRLRERSQSNLVVIEIHGSELASPKRLGFSLTSVLAVGPGELAGFDFAPNDLSWWRYQLANPIVLRLLAGRAVSVPVRPLVGAPFTISVPVRRSDTNQALISGSVTCKVLVGGKRVPAQGRFRAGKAQCTLRVPSTGGTVSGSVIVRSGGATVTSRFSFRAPRVRPLPG